MEANINIVETGWWNLMDYGMTKYFFLSVFFLNLIMPITQISSEEAANTIDQQNTIYLPIISKGRIKPIILGLYPTGWMGDQAVVDSQLNDLEDWSEKKITLAGTFIGITETTDGAINQQLNKIYENGYTPFINIMTDKTAAEFANGNLNKDIILWANKFKQVVDIPGRVAYIALMPEMNGSWVSYKYDPENYKKSMVLLQNIFYSQGIQRDTVKWVFAPNGWSFPDHNFEYYYPGDEFIDVVGFSAYNFGYCPAQAAWPGWISLQSAVEGYIFRAQKMAPEKPIFITQTGTTAFDSNGLNENAKNDWLREGYQYLAAESRIQAILYFNIEDSTCDLAIFRTWPSDYAKFYPGYKDGIQSPVYQYFTPGEIKSGALFP